MNRIYFHCDWASNGEFMNDLRKQTSNEDGRWGSIKMTGDIKSADYCVAFNSANKVLEDKKLILYCMESAANLRCDGWEQIDAIRKLSISDLYKPQRWFVQKNYDELNSLNCLNKKKDLSWITTDKGRRGNSCVRKVRRLISKIGYKKYEAKKIPKISLSDRSLQWFRFPGDYEGHILRMDFLDKIIDQYPNIIDLYGRGDFSYGCYRGMLDNKWDGLEEYRYTLAIENYKGKNYFSEKLTDALMSWCMPIYWGCTNLDNFLPKNSYVWIDIESKDAPGRIQEIIESDLRERNLDAIAEARQRLLEEYQVWPTVERTINSIET